MCNLQHDRFIVPTTSADLSLEVLTHTTNTPIIPIIFATLSSAKYPCAITRIIHE